MTDPKAVTIAFAELRTRATALAHALMKPPAESFEVRERCRRRTRSLVRSGRLVRQACEGCGAATVQAHHENYRRPEHVRWVCRRCHEAVHRGSVLPVKLPPNPTNDDIVRWLAVLILRGVVLMPEPTPTTLYVDRTAALAIGRVSSQELRAAVKAGKVKQRGRRYRRKDLEAL
jgi:ribosomal protein S27AE